MCAKCLIISRCKSVIQDTYLIFNLCWIKCNTNWQNRQSISQDALCCCSSRWSEFKCCQSEIYFHCIYLFDKIPNSILGLFLSFSMDCTCILRSWVLLIWPENCIQGTCVCWIFCKFVSPFRYRNSVAALTTDC